MQYLDDVHEFSELIYVMSFHHIDTILETVLIIFYSTYVIKKNWNVIMVSFENVLTWQINSTSREMYQLLNEHNTI